MKNNKQIQLIRRSCCNTIFAGCAEPYCYTDEDWTISLKEYVEKGCKVEYVEASKGLQFEECKCKQNEKLYTKEDFLNTAHFCEVSMIDAKYIIERIDEIADPIEIPNYDKVTRFEVIDHTSKMGGRTLVERNVNVEISIQDEGRTMKVFLTDKIYGGNNEQQ